MLAPLVKFTDDAAALEKTLRLIQSSCTIAIGLLAGSDDILPWLQARKQIALGLCFPTDTPAKAQKGGTFQLTDLRQVADTFDS